MKHFYVLIKNVLSLLALKGFVDSLTDRKSTVKSDNWFIMSHLNFKYLLDGASDR